MKKLLYFEEMFTPKIITYVFWLALFIVIVSGLMFMFGGYGGFSFGSFIGGIITIVAGAVGARIWCELLIVLFKINENVKKLANGEDKDIANQAEAEE